MNPTTVLGLLGGLLALAFLANRLFRWTRVPDVILLMGVGLILGPLMGWVDADQLRPITHVFGTLAVILILFEGGLELNLRETVRHFPGGLVLTALAFGLSLGLGALVLQYSLGIPLRTAVLMSTVLACTSSTVVLPVLQQLKLREPLNVWLILEASLGDVLAVLLVEILLDFTARGGATVSNFVAGFLYKFLPAVVLAVLAGVLWSRLLRVLSEQRFWHVLTLAFVLLLYAGTEALHASGLIAVLGFGLTLANFPGVDRKLVEATLRVEGPPIEHHAQILTFHSEVAFLVRTFFFVLIGAVVELGGLEGRLLPMVGVLGALFVSRWLAVQGTRWMRGSVNAASREVVLWIFPRGLITAVLAIQVAEQGGPEFAFLPALAFAIILATNVIVIFGTIRARRHTAEREAEDQTAASAEQPQAPPSPQESNPQ